MTKRQPKITKQQLELITQRFQVRGYNKITHIKKTLTPALYVCHKMY